MLLEPGQSLLHYRLTEKLGEGGMGVVWKATDTTLDREVAIKLLPQAFADHPDRLMRFEREAKLLASLNHPHIAAVYGLHQADTPSGAVRFIAMELVVGEDLEQRLARGPLPVAEALGIASQIAEGLSAAHEAGVIHRDLKPANVKLTAEGKVKVLDFGLAKAFDPAAQSGSIDTSLSPTITSTGTMAGMILGTAAYMSPEQARGRPTDRRTDIWAFGALLFEMLDAGNGRLSGDPFPLANDITDTFPRTARSAFSVSDNGVLMYLELPKVDSRIDAYDRNGRKLENVAPSGEYQAPVLSNDGKQVALTTISGGETTIWHMDLARASASRLMTTKSTEPSLVWSTDDRSILHSAEGRMFRLPISGGEDEVLLDSQEQTQRESLIALRQPDESADGSFVAFSAWDPVTDFDLWIMLVDPSASRFKAGLPLRRFDGPPSIEDRDERFFRQPRIVGVDGERFLFHVPDGELRDHTIEVVLNWEKLLER